LNQPQEKPGYKGGDQESYLGTLDQLRGSQQSHLGGAEQPKQPPSIRIGGQVRNYETHRPRFVEVVTPTYFQPIFWTPQTNQNI
jgi:hypothetical protein